MAQNISRPEPADGTSDRHQFAVLPGSTNQNVGVCGCFNGLDVIRPVGVTGMRWWKKWCAGTVEGDFMELE